jgi:hypothetical protein
VTAFSASSPEPKSKPGRLSAVTTTPRHRGHVKHGREAVQLLEPIVPARPAGRRTSPRGTLRSALDILYTGIQNGSTSRASRSCPEGLIDWKWARPQSGRSRLPGGVADTSHLLVRWKGESVRAQDLTQSARVGHHQTHDVRGRSAARHPRRTPTAQRGVQPCRVLRSSVDGVHLISTCYPAGRPQRYESGHLRVVEVVASYGHGMRNGLHYVDDSLRTVLYPPLSTLPCSRTVRCRPLSCLRSDRRSTARLGDPGRKSANPTCSLVPRSLQYTSLSMAHSKVPTDEN